MQMQNDARRAINRGSDRSSGDLNFRSKLRSAQWVSSEMTAIFIIDTVVVITICVNIDAEQCKMGNNKRSNKSFDNPSFKLTLRSTQRVNDEVVTIFIINVVVVTTIYVNVESEPYHRRMWADNCVGVVVDANKIVRHRALKLSFYVLCFVFLSIKLMLSG